MPSIQLIHNTTKSLGFDALGVVALEGGISFQDSLHEFLKNHFHGDMDWMESRSEIRGAPTNLWPEAKSVIVVGHNYGPASNPLEKLADKARGNISCYAGGDDYHDVIKSKLKQLAGWMQSEYGGEYKVFVDTAPLMEKPLAAQSGVGWQGKHTCLVSREFGSWLFLGFVFTTLSIAASEPEKDHCGTCRQCLDICPTQAFVGERKLDARRCISYLTIEHKGHIALEFRKAIGNRIYGCDDCLAVCPWNKFAQTTQEVAYHVRKDIESPLLRELLAIDDIAFRKLFSKSPVKRIKRDRFIRNVLIACGNSEDSTLITNILPLLSDASALVRAMAVWAIKELDPLEFLTQRTIYIGNESDSNVLEEWNRD